MSDQISFTITDVERPKLLERLLRQVVKSLDSIKTRLERVEKAPVPPPPYASIKKALQSDGVAPLHVGNLRGILTDPQIPFLQLFTSVPTGQTLQALRDGVMIYVSGNNTVYRVNSGNPNTLTALTPVGAAHNFLSATHTDTVAAAPTLGAIVYGSAAPAWTLLAGNTTALKKVLTQTGTGAVSAVPAWAQLAFSDLSSATSTNGATFVTSFSEEEITLSTVGVTTDSSANLLPGNSLILAVTGRVTTTISGGGVTSVAVGTSASTARFNTLGTLTVGATVVGLNQWQGSVATDANGPVQYSAAKVRLTADVTPSAGKVRITVFYAQFAAATS